MKGDLRLLTLVAVALGAGACGGQSERNGFRDAEVEPPACGADAAADAREECGEAPSCDAIVPPCGGDVVGTWSVTGCPLELSGEVDVSNLGLGCISGETIRGSLEVSGTWTADADGLFWDDTTTKGVHEFSLPASCFDVLFWNDCASLGQPLTGVGYATAQCADDPATGGCTCAGTFDQRGGLAAISSSPFEMGRYYLMGNRLSVDVEQYGTPYGYCVTGDAMVVTLPSPTRVGEVFGSIVLEKQ